MHPLEKETLDLITCKKLIGKGEKLVVGVSGGPDSMALMHVLQSISIELAVSLVAAYVDHGLRPLEVAREKNLVAAACANLGIPLECHQADVKAIAADMGVSVEHAGRDVRYAFFDKVLEKHRADKIALAHTGDDQAEEVLLRLIRGTGRKGLAGMALLRDGRIVRPFINVPKKNLLSYLADKGTGYCIDSSNLEKMFLRNRVRLDLIPYLEKNFNPEVSDVLRRTAGILGDEEAFLENIVKGVVQKTVVFLEQGGRVSAELFLLKFNTQHVAIQRRVLETVFWQCGVKPGFRQIEQVLRVCGSEGEGAVSHHAEGLRVEKKTGRLVFSFPQGRSAKRGNLSKAETVSYSLKIDKPGVYEVREIGKLIEIELLEKVPDKKSMVRDNADYFDAGMLGFPFVLREVRPGDRFRPLGYPGRKKAASFFIDQKVPQSERGNYPVLESNGKIAALLGLRIDHNFRIKETTKTAVRIDIHDLNALHVL